jgi:hypothetical protein
MYKKPKLGLYLIDKFGICKDFGYWNEMHDSQKMLSFFPFFSFFFHFILFYKIIFLENMFLVEAMRKERRY